MVVLERHDQLDLSLYSRVAFEREPVVLAPDLPAAVDRARAALLAHLDAGGPAYGVTTGLGFLATHAIEPEDQAAFQRRILAGRAAAVGPPLSEPVVRGVMLLRLAGFLSGRVGVSAALCEFIAARLNDRWLPLVPAGVTGAAGEIVPLAHLFQTLLGDGLVLADGATVPVPAARALQERGVEPYELGTKEAIALINGAPLAPALAVPLALRARALLEHATLAGALAIVLTGASARPYSVRVGRLKGDPSQESVHRRLAELLAGGARLDAAHQAPVSLRVIPQVHGAASDLLDHLDAQIARELRAVTDSPVFLPAEDDEPEGLYATGNFHAGAITLLLDSVAIAFTHVLNLVEKRLHRLLDARFSGLSDQLARDPGRQSGLVILHKQVIGLVAEARTLASPATVHVLDGSTGQEDFQAHTLLAAQQLERILANLELGLAHELVALRQAHYLAGSRTPPAAGPRIPPTAGPRIPPALGPRIPPALEPPVAQLAGVVAEVAEDRSLAADVERTRELIASGRLVPHAPTWAPLLASPCVYGG